MVNYDIKIGSLSVDFHHAGGLLIKDHDDDLIYTRKQDAIALANAILKHFEEDEAINLTVGKRYTSKNGNTWQCIANIGDVFWMAGILSDRVTGAAYTFKQNGEHICLNADYDIVEEIEGI